MHDSNISAIIARLDAEVCPIHGKKATIYFNQGILSIQDTCCQEFHDHLVEMSKTIKNDDPEGLLERFVGLVGQKR